MYGKNSSIDVFAGITFLVKNDFEIFVHKLTNCTCNTKLTVTKTSELKRTNLDENFDIKLI